MTNNPDFTDKALNEADDYLWDRSGEADDIAVLEQSLSAFRYRPQGRPHRSASPRARAPLFAAAAALVLVAVSARLALQTAPGTAAPWAVRALAGSPTIDASLVADEASLGIGQWLETGEGEEAVIDVADIGSVTVRPNSRLRLVESRQGLEHRLQLARGELDAFITAPPRLFVVDTPAALAVDLGCAYNLLVDESGDGVIAVAVGWVALEKNRLISTVPADGICLMRAGRGPGTPWFSDATDVFADALERFDFEDGGTESIDTILAQARPRDTLTLWHLLSRVDAPDRQRIVERIVALADIPATINVEAVMNLDGPTLRRWWAHLELTW